MPLQSQGDAMLEGARVHTTLPAMDIERAKAFYAKKVGATAGDSSPGGTFFMFGECAS
jgi:predicted enzyme related to lactoylglutathione lyase